MLRSSRFVGALLFGVSMLVSSAALADGGAVWGITTTELLLPPEIVLILHEPGTQSTATTWQKSVYIGTVLVSTAVPVTVGLVAETEDWDTTVPRAAHLGLWSGLSLLMVGSALSASHDEPLLIAPSPIPWIFGGVVRGGALLMFAGAL